MNYTLNVVAIPGKLASEKLAPSYIDETILSLPSVTKKGSLFFLSGEKDSLVILKKIVNLDKEKPFIHLLEHFKITEVGAEYDILNHLK